MVKQVNTLFTKDFKIVPNRSVHVGSGVALLIKSNENKLLILKIKRNYHEH